MCNLNMPIWCPVGSIFSLNLDTSQLLFTLVLIELKKYFPNLPFSLVSKPIFSITGLSLYQPWSWFCPEYIKTCGSLLFSCCCGLTAFLFCLFVTCIFFSSGGSSSFIEVCLKNRSVREWTASWWNQIWRCNLNHCQSISLAFHNSLGKYNQLFYQGLLFSLSKLPVRELTRPHSGTCEHWKSWRNVNPTKIRFSWISKRETSIIWEIQSFGECRVSVESMLGK